MKKHYIFLFIVLITTCFYGQEIDDTNTSDSNQEALVQKYREIEGFKIYPNPVVNGKLFIQSFNNTDKKVQIYTILGKQILSIFLRGNELNLSRLDSGVYILKVYEKDKISTRKLVVK